MVDKMRKISFRISQQQFDDFSRLRLNYFKTNSDGFRWVLKLAIDLMKRPDEINRFLDNWNKQNKLKEEELILVETEINLLSNIASNLNQITRKINSKNAMNVSDLNLLVKCLDDFKKLEKKLKKNNTKRLKEVGNN